MVWVIDISDFGYLIYHDSNIQHIVILLHFRSLLQQIQRLRKNINNTKVKTFYIYTSN